MKKQATKKEVKKIVPEKKYKLHLGLPAMTQTEWIDTAKKMYPHLLEYKRGKTKSQMFEDEIKFYNKILKTFKIKTI